MRTTLRSGTCNSMRNMLAWLCQKSCLPWLWYTSWPVRKIAHKSFTHIPFLVESIVRAEVWRSSSTRTGPGEAVVPGILESNRCPSAMKIYLSYNIHYIISEVTVLFLRNCPFYGIFTLATPCHLPLHYLPVFQTSGSLVSSSNEITLNRCYAGVCNLRKQSAICTKVNRKSYTGLILHGEIAKFPLLA